jgi:hypothetical protein
MGLLRILGGGGVHGCFVVCVVWLEEEPRVDSRILAMRAI